MGCYDEIKHWADALDVDVVPLLYQGKVSNPEMVIDMVKNTTSYLGGQMVEGVVVKNYKPWLFMGQILTPVMAGKYVSEAFKETHNKDWKKLNTGKGKFEELKDKYRSEARWDKAIMRLKEEGNYTGSLKDIGAIIKIVRLDILEEERDNIKHDLWAIYKDDVLRGVTNGIPQWYKEKLLIGDTDESESDRTTTDDTAGTGEGS
jgi:hypothetical protein